MTGLKLGNGWVNTLVGGTTIKLFPHKAEKIARDIVKVRFASSDKEFNARLTLLMTDKKAMDLGLVKDLDISEEAEQHGRNKAKV